MTVVVAMTGVEDEGVTRHLRGDNIGGLQILTNPEGSWRTRHLRLRSQFLRERVREGLWRLQHVPGTELSADMLTKAITLKSSWTTFKNKVKMVEMEDLEAAEQKRSIAKVAIAAVGMAVLSTYKPTGEGGRQAKIAGMTAFAAYMAYEAKKVLGGVHGGGLQHQQQPALPGQGVRIAALRGPEGEDGASCVERGESPAVDLHGDGHQVPQGPQGSGSAGPSQLSGHQEPPEPQQQAPSERSAEDSEGAIRAEGEGLGGVELETMEKLRVATRAQDRLTEVPEPEGAQDLAMEHQGEKQPQVGGDLSGERQVETAEDKVPKPADPEDAPDADRFVVGHAQPRNPWMESQLPQQDQQDPCEERPEGMQEVPKVVPHQGDQHEGRPGESETPREVRSELVQPEGHLGAQSEDPQGGPPAVDEGPPKAKDESKEALTVPGCTESADEGQAEGCQGGGQEEVKSCEPQDHPEERQDVGQEAQPDPSKEPMMVSAEGQPELQPVQPLQDRPGEPAVTSSRKWSGNTCWRCRRPLERHVTRTPESTCEICGKRSGDNAVFYSCIMSKCDLDICQDCVEGRQADPGAEEPPAEHPERVQGEAKSEPSQPSEVVVVEDKSDILDDVILEVKEAQEKETKKEGEGEPSSPITPPKDKKDKKKKHSRRRRRRQERQPPEEEEPAVKTDVDQEVVEGQSVGQQAAETPEDEVKADPKEPSKSGEKVEVKEKTEVVEKSKEPDPEKKDNQGPAAEEATASTTAIPMLMKATPKVKPAASTTEPEAPVHPPKLMAVCKTCKKQMPPYISEVDGYSCSVCGTEFSKGTKLFGCRPHDYDLCGWCANDPSAGPRDMHTLDKAKEKHEEQAANKAAKAAAKKQAKAVNKRKKSGPPGGWYDGPGLQATRDFNPLRIPAGPESSRIRLVPAAEVIGAATREDTEEESWGDKWPAPESPQTFTQEDLKQDERMEVETAAPSEGPVVTTSSIGIKSDTKEEQGGGCSKATMVYEVEDGRDPGAVGTRVIRRGGPKGFRARSEGRK